MTAISMACVYRTGGDFESAHAVALYHSFMEHNADLVDEFVLLTDSYTARRQFDDVDKARVVWLCHDTPGWWAKIELFRPDVFSAGQRVAYLDLDTIPTGRLDALLDPGESEFLASRGPRFGNLASGIMAWTHGRHGHTVVPTYVHDPDGVRRRYDGRQHGRSAGTRGDQGFVADRLAAEGTRWLAVEDEQPGVSRYGRDGRLSRYRGTATVPADVRLVVFSGRGRRPDRVWPELWWPAVEDDRWTP